MSPNNKRNTETKLGIVIIAITALGFLFVTPKLGIFGNRQTDTAQNNNADTDSSEAPLENSDRQQGNRNLESRISNGEEILVGANNNPDKELAVEAFAKGDSANALTVFDKSLEAQSNDPEALIYFNNSIATIDPHPVKIAVSVPIGGSLDVAQEILRGVAQAQNEINNAGKGNTMHNGKKHLVQIEIANDDNNPEVATQIAAEFVSDPEILAVIGHNSSAASLAAAPIYEEGNLVMMSPTSVASELTRAGDRIFRTTPSTDILAQTLAGHVIEGGWKRIAICLDSESPASSSFSSSFSTSIFQLGGEIIDTSCDFASGEFNPRSVPSEAIARGAESLLLIPSVDRINQALEVAKANDNRLPLFGNHSMYTHQTLRIGQSDVNGMVLPVSWHPESKPNSAFNREAEKLWGTPSSSWRTASSYDAVMSLAEGLSRAENREQLHSTLASTSFSASGVLGKIKFQNTGDRLIKGTLVEVLPAEDSSEFKFEPVARQGKANSSAGIKTSLAREKER